MPANDQVKPFWKSRTVYLNLIASALLIFIEHPYNSETIAQALALGNIVLRFFTHTGVTLSPR
jgi:hypothetical protein